MYAPLEWIFLGLLRGFESIKSSLSKDRAKELTKNERLQNERSHKEIVYIDIKYGNQLDRGCSAK